MIKGLIKKLPSHLRKIGARINNDLKPARVYLVGGAVRDLLLKRITKDYDLVVSGIPAKTLERWLAKRGQVNLVGKTFGVYKWQPAGWKGEVIDVALPRTEHVSMGTGEYRDFKIKSNPDLPIQDDLLRRDFTINALALNLSNGCIIDPARGLFDIKNKKIKTVGYPEQRFKEDLSRTLRAIRFACQLGFKIESATLKNLSVLSHKTSLGKKEGNWLVPREIIARELLKSFIANPFLAMDLFDKTGFMSELLPEVTALHKTPQPRKWHSEGDVWQHTKLALTSFENLEWQKFFGKNKPSLNVIIGTLLHDIGKPLTLKTPKKDGVDRIRTDGHDVAGARLVPNICQRLKLTSYTDSMAGQIKTETITWLVNNHLLLAHGEPEIFKPTTIYRYFLADPVKGLELQQVIFADMYGTRPIDGSSLLPRLYQLQKRINEVNQKLTQGKLKLLLNGKEIMKELKLKPGPQIGQLLKIIEEAQLEGRIKNKKQAKQYLREYKININNYY